MEFSDYNPKIQLNFWISHSLRLYFEFQKLYQIKPRCPFCIIRRNSLTLQIVYLEIKYEQRRSFQLS